MSGCATVPPSARPASSRAGRARVTSQPPGGLQPARNLSAQDRRANFEALWRAVDTTYADFELKSIDWNEVGRRYRLWLDNVGSDDEFYRLLARMIGELKDTHSWLQNFRAPSLPQLSSIAVESFDDKPFVVAVMARSEAERDGVRPGWEIVSVDGLTPAEKVEALRPLLNGFSSERAFRRDATRHLLADERPTPAAIVLRDAGGDMHAVTLPRDEARLSLRPPALDPDSS